MTSPEPPSGDVFDLQNFARLVELMCEHDINEVDLKRGDQRVRLRRGQAVAPTAPVQIAPPPQASPPPQAAPAASQEGGGSPAEADDEFVYVTAETLGTFYESPNPEQPAYVKVGDHVGPDTVVCIIEAMKVFNEIKAGCSGKIVSVLVNNEDPVEYGQKLFKVDPRG